MIEDKLSLDQRIRLECLAQAIAASHAMRTPASPEVVVQQATTFERFVRGQETTS